jgi:Putative MetA-pathway of phenol degradation
MRVNRPTTGFSRRRQRDRDTSLAQYDSGQLVNLGYNRWAVKPETGVSHSVARWTVEGYASVWTFGKNDSYYPGDAVKRQHPVFALQGHASYVLPGGTWLALDGTRFVGGETRTAVH